MCLDMGSLTGVGLTSPGISNGHRARAMSCLEGGTFLCVSVCMLSFVVCVHVCVCLCASERKIDSRGIFA